MAARASRGLAARHAELLVGAGTVLDGETARACMDAGARFIVSPATDRETIDFCKRLTVPVVPGALTPTEILTAWEAGADLVKVKVEDIVGRGEPAVLDPAPAELEKQRPEQAVADGAVLPARRRAIVRRNCRRAG